MKIPYFRIDEAVRKNLLNALENYNDNYPVDVIFGVEGAPNITPEEWLERHLYYYPYASAQSKDKKIELHTYIDKIYPDLDGDEILIDYAVETVIPTGMDKVNLYGREESRSSMMMSWIIDSLDNTNGGIGELEFYNYARTFGCILPNAISVAHRPNYYGHKIIFKIKIDA